MSIVLALAEDCADNIITPEELERAIVEYSVDHELTEAELEIYSNWFGYPTRRNFS